MTWNYSQFGSVPPCPVNTCSCMGKALWNRPLFLWGVVGREHRTHSVVFETLPEGRIYSQSSFLWSSQKSVSCCFLQSQANHTFFPHAALSQHSSPGALCPQTARGCLSWHQLSPEVTVFCINATQTLPHRHRGSQRAAGWLHKSSATALLFCPVSKAECNSLSTKCYIPVFGGKADTANFLRN